MPSLHYFDNLLKDQFADADLTPATLVNATYLKMVGATNQGGKQTLRPIIDRGSRNGGSNYADAKTAAGVVAAQGTGDQWVVRRGSVTSLVHVLAEDAYLSESPTEAWAEARVKEVEDGLAEHGLKIEDMALANEGGSVATGTYADASVSGAPTFSIRFAGDARQFVKYFRPGDQVEVSLTDGSGSVPTKLGSTGVVQGIGFSPTVGGGVTFIRMATTAAPGTPANPGSWGTSNTVFIWKRGTFPTSVGNATTLTPLSAYIPLAYTPGSQPDLHGVSRADNELRCGVRLVASEISAGMPLHQRVSQLAMKMKAFAAVASKYVALFDLEAFERLNQEAVALNGAQAQRKTNEYGYSSFVVNTALGEVECVCEPRVPPGAFRIIPVGGRNEIQIDAAGGKLANIVWRGQPDTASTGDARFETLIMCQASQTVGNPACYGVGTTA